MRKIQKKHRKLLKNDENCIIIEMHPNNVKKITIELDSATHPDQSDLFVFNNGQALKIGEIKNISDKEIKDLVKDKKMGPINILDAANFLIQLYYKTAKRYNCTRTKIEKLLVLANLIAFANNTTLFDHAMLINKCGVGIPILGGFYLSNIVEGEDSNKAISPDLIDESIIVPTVYKLQSEIDDNTQKLLIEIFLKFGAYDAWRIGNMYDEFKYEISDTNPQDIEHPIIVSAKTNTYFF